MFLFGIYVDPGGPVVIILASGSEVPGFDPGSVKISSMTSFGKEPRAEIRASEQNLSNFSRSMSEATLMT